MMNVNYLLSGIVAIILAFFYHKYHKTIYDYWKKRGIPCVNGVVPYFGNILSLITLRQGFNNFCEKIYKSHENLSMIGFYQFDEPTLMIRDPEIVKTVLISNFANFHVNVLSVDPSFDPLAARNPFFTDGEQWKNERSRLSVVFMSSKKLKILHAAIKNVCDKFKIYLDENLEKSKGSYVVETKDLFSCFTGEVVASAGFGVEGDFFSHGCGPNSFRQAVTGAFEPTFANNVKQTVLFSFPRLNKFLGLSFVPKHADNFLRRVVSEIVKLRRNEDVKRNDFLQIMIDMEKSRGKELDEFGIAVSAASFFFDGYETSAITLGFFAYQIATNLDVQRKLRDEILEVLERHDGQLTYEALGEMTYMDRALNESMRLHPALGFLVKRCNDSCKLVGSDGLECIVESGTAVVVSVRGLHTDSKYWRDPEFYDPERFNDENKKNRSKTIFLPFGEGPRMCVGMRFAVLQMKAAMATILRYYAIELSSRTVLPLRFKATPVLTAVEGGLWIKFKSL